MKTQEFPIEIKRGSALVKIYKTPEKTGTDAYTLSYWHNGKRKREKFADLQEAKEEAAKAANQLTQGDY